MIKQVIKKDGDKVPFDAKKITRAITRAAQDAKLDSEEINKIVNDVSNTMMVFAESKGDKVMSSEIRDEILSQLDLLAPRVSVEWRKYMNSKR